MTETDHYNLYRKYHASTKNDDDLFNIRYTIADDNRPHEGSEQEDKDTKK